MLYDESTSSSLKPWLVRSLQPICDADPEALADYVLALLKHDAAEPDLRKMFINQLEEFLEKEAAKFVDTLFAALRTKSYLPYESPKTEVQDAGIPIPIDALMSGSSDRSRKRSLGHDEHDHPLPKGPRLGNDGSYSRYESQNGHMSGRGASSHRGGHTNGRGMGRGEGMSTNGQMQHQIGSLEGGHMHRHQGGGFNARTRRGICRDYHNNGFCARGSLCQYSHGDDAVIPPMSYVNGTGIVNSIHGGGGPFMPMFPSNPLFVGMSGAAYDPHESHMEMGRGHNRGPRLDNRVHEAIPVPSVELPVIQDLTPQDPVEEAGRGEAVVQPNGFTHNFGTPRRAQLQQQVNMLQPSILGQVGGGWVGNGPMPMEGIQMGGNHLGGGGGGFRRGGRGTFTGEVHSFRNTPRDDKTLVVEKIPDDKLSLEAVNDWFKRFGTVTNVAIDPSSSKALVSFSNHTEAHTAWKSEEAVFGNRFVRLFWHRPLDGQGAAGQRALAASAPLIKHIANPDASPSPLVEESTPVQPAPDLPNTPNKQTPKLDATTAATLATRQQLLEKQISEQKALMSRLSAATTPQEKQEIMAQIRNIQKGMTSSTPVSPQVSTSKSTNGKGGTRVLSEKERLDKELELHAAQTALGGQTGTDGDATTTAALKEKLAQLKAEASRLGLPEGEMDVKHSELPSTSYRPYRGRGFRARGLIRGRGGLPARGSMKLDNRPRKLLIQDVPNEEAIQAIRNHYQNMGNLESFWKEGDGQVVAQFWSRSAAELALASGSDIPSVGKVKISWHTGPAPSLTALLPASPVRTESSDIKKNQDPIVLGEAETGTSRVDHDDGGWGQAFDDDEDISRRRRSRSRSRSFS